MKITIRIACESKICGGKIESPKANDVLEKIKAEVNKHSTGKSME